MKSIEPSMLKGAIAAYLHANGQSLMDLEATLASGQTKTAEGAPFSLTDLLGFMRGVGEVGLGSSVLAGGTAGLGLYGAYKGIQDSQQRIEKGDSVKQRINLARRELESIMQQGGEHA